jgi:hypothetical protein
MANAWIIEPLSIVSLDGAADAGFERMNLANDYAGVVWRASAAGNRNLIVDLGADRAVDTLMLFGVRTRAAGATVTVSYRAEASAQGAWQAGVSNAPVLAGTASVGDAGIGLFDLPATVVARYLSLDFHRDTDGTIEASRLVVGKRLQLERNFGFGAEFGIKDLGTLEFSRRGVLLRNRGAKLRTAQLTFSSVRRDEVERLTAPLLERIGNTECVALVTDPAPHAQRQRRCYFGPLVGDLGQTWRRANAWEAKINMVSLF